MQLVIPETTTTRRIQFALGFGSKDGKRDVSSFGFAYTIGNGANDDSFKWGAIIWSKQYGLTSAFKPAARG